MTPQKYPQNLHSKKRYFFLRTPQKIEIQNFEPQKITRAYYPGIQFRLPCTPKTGFHRAKLIIGTPRMRNEGVLKNIWFELSENA